MPGAIQDFVHSRFGLEMTTAHVSNYKTAISREKGKSHSAHKPAPAVKEAPAAPIKHAAPAMAHKAVGIDLQDIETVKTLVERVGTDNLTSLIDLLSK